MQSVLISNLPPLCLFDIFILFRSYCDNSFSNTNLNKEKHELDGVWMSVLNSHRFLRSYVSVFFSVLYLIERIYQSHKTV